MKKRFEYALIATVITALLLIGCQNGPFAKEHDDENEIKIEHTGTTITAEFDDEKLITLEDNTFLDAGKVGLWTKADATTAFDDFEVEEKKENDD